MSLQHMLPTQTSKSSSPENTVARQERRAAVRRPAGEPALIEAASLDVALPCLVCDISTAGARLYVHDSAENLIGSRAKIPSKFTLSISGDRVEVDCAVVWRRLGLVGVRFLSSVRQVSRKGP